MACTINVPCRRVNYAPRSFIDYFRVMLQIVASLKIISYDFNMFIAQATGVYTYRVASLGQAPNLNAKIRLGLKCMTLTKCSDTLQAITPSGAKVL